MQNHQLKKQLFSLISLSFLAFYLSSCSESEKPIKISGPTMGTQYHISIITTPSNSSKNTNQSLKQDIDDLLIIVNQQMSTYIKNSEISRFNRYKKTDWFPVSKDFAYVVDAAIKVSQKTEGAFDITVSPLIDLWGFGSRSQYSIPTDKQITELQQHIGFKHLAVREIEPAIRKDDKQVHIDLSAIAKGFAVDKVSNYLTEKGFDDYLVEIGGEVRARGYNQFGEKWRVAIEQPDKAQQVINKVISISDKALATSGDYRNYYVKDNVRYSHTIDPKTGKPIKHRLASVTVIHESTMFADAYATALMVMGAKLGKAFALRNGYKINLIVREKEKGFSTWSNF